MDTLWEEIIFDLLCLTRQFFPTYSRLFRVHQQWTFGNRYIEQDVVQAGCPSCRPTNNVKAVRTEDEERLTTLDQEAWCWNLLTKYRPEEEEEEEEGDDGEDKQYINSSLIVTGML